VKSIDVFCVFPEAVDAMLRVGVVGRAIERGVVGYRSFDLRDFAPDGRIDDMPYGGGAGMVMRPEPLFAAVEPLRAEDLLRRVPIRGEPHTVVEAINRQLSHYAQHVGQIVFLAKHLRSSDWQTLSIARGQSGKFNESMARRDGKV
jgi:tRNA (guanine-N1)-methyltransferase